MKKLGTLFLAATMWGTGPTAAQADAPLIPVETFAALPAIQDAKMSPNGQQIGYVSRRDGRMVLFLENLDGSDRVMLPPLKDADIYSFYWATDNRVLIAYGFTEQVGGVGQRYFWTRLLGVDRNGENFGSIVKNEWTPDTGWRLGKDLPAAQLQHKILDLLPDDPDHILVSLDGDHDGADEIREINIHNGDFKIFYEDYRGIQNWRLDQAGNVRYGSGHIAGTSERAARVKDAQGRWVQLDDAQWAKTYSVVDFTEDPNVIYVTGPSQYGTRGLYKLALDSGTVIETIFEHESVDVDGLLKHPETGKPAGYVYTVDHPTHVYFDKTMAKVQSLVDKSLPGTRNYILGKAKGAHTYLVFADNAGDPGVYYWLDFTTKQLIAIGAKRGSFDKTRSASVEPVRIPARDGIVIPGYMTLPKGKRNAKGLPAVILVHGGPYGVRDTADWNWWAQFLASRGYAVLQPNFRGSGGYGHAFQNAGEKQYGGLMQDDVTDATKWLVDQGIADGSRVCIAGGSYGGYAALMGVIKEPGLYRCAVSVNGVTDVPRSKRDDKHLIGGRDWVKDIGLEGHDDEDVSPYDRATDVSAPVLLIAAKDDARIDYDMTKDMGKKLRKLGKDSRYVELEDGGHSMDTGAARLTMLKAMESFLAEHIGTAH